MKSIILSVAALLSFSAIHAQESEGASFSGGKDQRFVISAAASYGYRLGKTPDNISSEQKEYLEELKSGFSLDISAFYKLAKNHGLGFKYNVFYASNTMNNLYIEAPNGDTGFGSIKDDIMISFIGPAYMFDYINGRNQFNVEGSIGYMSYINDAQALGEYEYFGDTIGVIFSGSYKYMVTEHFSIGPRIALVGGNITNFEVDGPNGYRDTFTLEDDNSESLWRFDAGVNFAFRF